MIGTTDPCQPQTSEENPGDIIDEPPQPVIPELSIGDPYDPGEKLWNQEAAYAVEKQEDGSTKISWTDGRGAWAKIWQDVSDWSAEEGEYLKIALTLERATDVYILYVKDTTGAGETQMYRADLAAGMPLTLGAVYDVNATLGQPPQYAIAETEDGVTVVSWNDGRDTWAKAQQDVSGYDVSKGKYLKIVFTADQTTKFGVYIGDTALMEHTEFAQGTHTVYLEIPENTGTAFSLIYYFDAGVNPVKAGTVSFAEISIVAEKPAA